MADRRDFLTAGSLTLLALFLSQGRQSFAAGRNINAFNARSADSMYVALRLPRPVESQAIRIEAPDVAENGANVPVEVHMDLPNVERMLLVAERNLFPLLADVSFTPQVEPWFEAKIKLAENSTVRALVVADGKLYTAGRSVRVIVGGCLPG